MFLYFYLKDPEVSDVGDDDQNDPEYNFLAEEEAVDEEDFRNDKTVEITSKSSLNQNRTAVWRPVVLVL